MRKILFVVAGTVLFIVIVLVSAHRIVERAAGPYLYEHVEAVPHHNVALVLGTANRLATGVRSPYFTHRMNAAGALYEAGKVSYLVVSGDNGREDYNEPEAMKQALIARGIPEDRIYLDYAGFDTYVSVVLVRDIFGQTSVTVVSQRFHAARAIYIARQKGIVAVGFVAHDIAGEAGKKVRIREIFARVKAVVDVVVNKKPRFLGEAVSIPAEENVL